MRLTLFTATLGMALAAFVVLLASAAEPIGRCSASPVPAAQPMPARPMKKVMT